MLVDGVTVSPRYVAWLNDPEVVRFSEQRHRRHSEESCRDFVKSFDGVTAHIWAIEVDGQHVGNITAHRDIPNGTADIGILLGERSAWGKGIGAAAYSAAADWLLANECRMVTGGTMSVNAGMLRVFAKSGFMIDGRRPGFLLLDGEPVDMVYASRRLLAPMPDAETPEWLRA